MIVDTSAWIDFSRDAASAIGDRIDEALAAEVAMTVDVVRLELLAGADAASRNVVQRLLAGCRFVSQLEQWDVDAAASMFQFCRRRGETVRSPNDCLIASIAIRVGVPVLHKDRDFDVIARHTGLVALRA